MNESLDEEVIALVHALNRFEGINTISSCCGHGKSPFCIWFKAELLEDLPPIIYLFDKCHCGFWGWKVEVITDCAESPVTFMIEGPVGAYDEANEIAKIMVKRFERGDQK